MCTLCNIAEKASRDGDPTKHRHIPLMRCLLFNFLRILLLEMLLL